MPAALTHYTFVKENVDNKSPYFMETCLGGQGPDIFFFYAYSFSKRENVKEVRDFGTLLHHSDFSEIYMNLIKYAKQSEQKEMLFAYLTGLFMHYVLDRNLHPYIFYRSGFVHDGSEKEKSRFMVAHQYFESGFDYLYSKRHKTLQNPKKCVKIPVSSLREISKMWSVAADLMNYDFIKQNTFELAYEDFRFANGFLYSPLKIKKFFFHLFKKNTSVDALSMPFTCKKAIKEDYLNENNSVWLDCVSGKKQNQSIDEMVQHACKYLPLIPKLLNANDPFVIKIFEDNFDHDGFKIGEEKKFFKTTN